MTMCDLVSDKDEFDRILGNIIDDALLDDPGETGTSVVGPPDRQVLVSLAVIEASYGVIMQPGLGLCQEPTPLL